MKTINKSAPGSMRMMPRLDWRSNKPLKEKVLSRGWTTSTGEKRPDLPNETSKARAAANATALPIYPQTSIFIEMEEYPIASPSPSPFPSPPNAGERAGVRGAFSGDRRDGIHGCRSRHVELAKKWSYTP